MQLLLEILPVFLFFIAFKLYGIYVATVVGIAATALQVVLYRLFTSKWDRKQLITLGVFLLFGGLTLYFHDPIFVKWKPTIIFWVFAIIILISQFVSSKPIIQRMMQSAIEAKDQVPVSLWRNLNAAWALFFATLGSINIYIAYNYDNNVWVNFKFYGITGALFVFSIVQAVFLMRYISEANHDKT